jgi:hypothetical protein
LAKESQGFAFLHWISTGCKTSLEAWHIQTWRGNKIKERWKASPFKPYMDCIFSWVFSTILGYIWYNGTIMCTISFCHILIYTLTVTNLYCKDH